MGKVSLYPNIRESKNGANVDLLKVLNGIKSGHWQAQVEGYRKSKVQNGKGSKEERDAKAKLPYFTTSGTFSHRAESGLIDHSGFIAIDIDDLGDVGGVKMIIECDPHAFAVFTSCGGGGLCVIFQIDPVDHEQAFRVLPDYFIQEYGVEIDVLADVSRPRFVSYDPEMWLNSEAAIYEPDFEEVPQPGTEAAPQPKPHQTTIRKTDEEIIRMGLSWVEKKYSFTKGERHKFIFYLACVCNRLGVHESTLLGFVNATYPHFAQNPSNAIQWVYARRKGEFGQDEKYTKQIVSLKPEETRGEIQEGEKDDFVIFLKSRSAIWDKPVSKPPAIISIDGHTISTAGNITTISGYSKSGKSGVLSAIPAGSMAGSIKPDTLGIDVMRNAGGKAFLSIDTEQSRYNFDRNYRQAIKRSGLPQPPAWFQAIWLKGLHPKQILDYTWKAARYYADIFGGIYIISIDGIGDYLNKLNDEEESRLIADQFALMAEEFNCPLITVLHLNPGSQKLRGHLGSHLQRKSESVLNIEKDTTTEISKITYPLLRNAGHVPEIEFEYDVQSGYHRLVGLAEGLKSQEDRAVEVALSIRDTIWTSRPAIEAQEAIKAVQNVMCETEARARKVVQLMLKRGLIRLDGDEYVTTAFDTIES